MYCDIVWVRKACNIQHLLVLSAFVFCSPPSVLRTSVSASFPPAAPGDCGPRFQPPIPSQKGQVIRPGQSGPQNLLVSAIGSEADMRPRTGQSVYFTIPAHRGWFRERQGSKIGPKNLNLKSLLNFLCPSHGEWNWFWSFCHVRKKLVRE